MTKELALTYFKKADALYDAGRFDEALDVFRKSQEVLESVLVTDPENVELREMLPQLLSAQGACNREKGDWDSAIPLYSRAIELNPNFARAFLSRGAAYCRKHEYDRAIADITRAYELNPNLAGDVFYELGLAYQFKGDYDRAIDEYTRLIETNPNFAGGFINRGDAYIKKGEWDLAIADLTRGIELNPSFTGALIQRGNAYVEKGDYDAAIADLTRVTELDPNNEDAQIALGLVRGMKLDEEKDPESTAVTVEDTAEDMRNWYAAVAIVKKLVGEGMKPGLKMYNPGVRAHAVALGIDDPRFDLALQLAFDRGWLEESNDWTIITRAGYEVGNAGRKPWWKAWMIRPFEAALALWRSLTGAFLNEKGDFDPENARAYYDRGNVYLKKGNVDRAIADYTKAIELYPTDIYYYDRGTAYIEKGELDRAIADYHEALAINPGFGDAYYNRGKIYEGKGAFDRAIADYDKAIELDPQEADAYGNRGLAYEKKGDEKRAIADYRKALELCSDDRVATAGLKRLGVKP